MPVAFGGFDLNRGLEAGQRLYGEGPRSGLGMAVKDLTDRAKQLNDLALKSKFEIATSGAIERQKSDLNPETQFLKYLTGESSAPAGVGAPGMKTNPFQAQGQASQPSQGTLSSRIESIQNQLPLGATVKAGPMTIEKPVMQQEKARVLNSANTAKRLTDELRKRVDSNYGGDYKRILRGPLDRDLSAVRDSLKAEIVSARGGQALTETEIHFLEKYLPGWFDALDAMNRNDDSVIRWKLNNLEIISQGLIDQLDPSAIESQLHSRPENEAQGNEWKQEASRMSREDLKRISGEE